MYQRIKRERKTVKKMIGLYCRKHHSSDCTIYALI
ncbi:nitrous oxide-stimulated promoter family protein [Chloroflexota bacterium]